MIPATIGDVRLEVCVSSVQFYLTVVVVIEDLAEHDGGNQTPSTLRVVSGREEGVKGFCQGLRVCVFGFSGCPLVMFQQL